MLRAHGLEAPQRRGRRSEGQVAEGRGPAEVQRRQLPQRIAEARRWLGGLVGLVGWFGCLEEGFGIGFFFGKEEKGFLFWVGEQHV